MEEQGLLSRNVCAEAGRHPGRLRAKDLRPRQGGGPRGAAKNAGRDQPLSAHRAEGSIMTDYTLLHRQLEALLRGVPYRTAALANAAALLYHSLDGVNWAGFYLMEGGALVLGPFQGKPACIEIPLGRGVCGTAAAEDRTQLVPDVHRFPGHIACDSASNAEIVVPLRAGGRVAGVLDIDNPHTGRFTEENRMGLEGFACILEEALWGGARRSI